MKKKGAAANKAKPARPKFDRSKLSAAFMNNAKASKEKNEGWAMDFENEAQNVAIPENQTDMSKTEQDQLAQVMKMSLEES